MKTAFVDTLFYLALANGDDEYHDLAAFHTLLRPPLPSE